MAHNDEAWSARRGSVGKDKDNEGQTKDGSLLLETNYGDKSLFH